MSNPTQLMPAIFRLRLQNTRVGRGIPGPRASRDAKSSSGRTSCWVCGGASLCDTERKVFHAPGQARNLRRTNFLSCLRVSWGLGPDFTFELIDEPLDD